MFIITNIKFYTYRNAWLGLALAMNTIFFLDLIAHIVVFGFIRLMRVKVEYFCEFLLQIAAQIITILLAAQPFDNKT